MTPSRFQKRIITIDLADLAEFHQEGLAEIAKRVPYRNLEDLLHVVLSRGILDILSAPNDRESLSPKEIFEKGEAPSFGAGLSSRAGMRVYPRPGVLYRERRKEQREQLEAEEGQDDHEIQQIKEDLGFARSPLGSETSERVAPAHHHVESYVPRALPEETRLRLEEFLEARPEFDEEEALAVLVRRGLDRTDELEDVVQTAREKTAAEMLSLAERLCARSRRRCGW